MRKRWIFSTGLVLFLCVAFFPISGLAQPAISYPPIASPVVTSDLALAAPIAVGPVASGGPTLNLQVFSQYTQPMDVYLALFAPTISPALFLVGPANNIQPISAGLVAWRQGVSAINNEAPFGSIPTSALPVGTYQLIMAVAPTGTLAPAALYRTSFGIGTTGDGDADGIPNAADAFPFDGLAFADIQGFLVPLNTQGSSFSAAVAVSNIGDGGFARAVGYRDDATGNVKGAVWDLDTIGRAAALPLTLNPLAGNSFSAAYDVNNAFIVVGESGKNGDTQFVAMVWSPGLAGAELPGLSPTGNSAAYAISSQGIVVGEAEIDEGAGPVTRAVLWSVDPLTGTVLAGPTPLSTAPLNSTASSAYFINDSGIIVGEATAGTSSFAFQWRVDFATGAQTAILLGNPGTEQSSLALSVNSNGAQTIGEFTDTTGNAHAAMWTLTAGGVVRTDLGLAGSLASINQNEPARFVGSVPAFNGIVTASIFDTRSANPAMGQPITGAVESHALDINNQGLVVGTNRAGAVDQAFLLITGP